MINIGKLDARITLQRATQSTDDQGSPVDTWADLAAVSARSKALKATEATEGNARSFTSDYEFTVRFWSKLADLSPTDKVKWRDVIFDILAATPMPEGRPNCIIITARRTGPKMPAPLPAGDFNWSDGTGAQWHGGTGIQPAPDAPISQWDGGGEAQWSGGTPLEFAPDTPVAQWGEDGGEAQWQGGDPLNFSNE